MAKIRTEDPTDIEVLKAGIEARKAELRSAQTELFERRTKHSEMLLADACIVLGATKVRVVVRGRSSSGVKGLVAVDEPVIPVRIDRWGDISFRKTKKNGEVSWGHSALVTNVVEFEKIEEAKE